MKRSRKRAKGGAGEPEIDARTEQVLRQALDRSGATDRSGVPTNPAPATAAEPAIAEEEDRGNSANPNRGAAGPKIGSLVPVSVDDTHFHRDPQSTQGWDAEEEADEGSAADTYDRLRGLMADLPIKAGTGKVEQNLEEVALATLNYYRYALAEPAGSTLPLGVTTGARSSVEDDLEILAGYLDLEKRFNRVDESLDPLQAAKQLMAALASRALAGTGASATANRTFVRKEIEECLREPAVGPAGPETAETEVPAGPETAGPGLAGPAAPAAGESPGSARLVYRRRGITGRRSD